MAEQSKTLDQQSLEIEQKNVEIRRLNLSLGVRTEQNEKELTIAQRQVIIGLYVKLNSCKSALSSKPAKVA